MYVAACRHNQLCVSKLCLLSNMSTLVCMHGCIIFQWKTKNKHGSNHFHARCKHLDLKMTRETWELSGVCSLGRCLTMYICCQHVQSLLLRKMFEHIRTYMLVLASTSMSAFLTHVCFPTWVCSYACMYTCLHHFFTKKRMNVDQTSSMQEGSTWRKSEHAHT